jgi:AbrB family looped-hinge helix DNA binding protein
MMKPNMTPKNPLIQTKRFLSDKSENIIRGVLTSEEVVVGKRYALVVPKSIREELGIEEGQRTLMRVEEGKIIIEPLPVDPFRLLGEIIREPYDEAKEEAKAERWLRKHAGR